MTAVQVDSMTPYSASRGLLYSAPPGPGGERTDADAGDGETTGRDEDADGAAVEGEGTPADD